MLKPLGFEFTVEGSPGMPAYSFLRPWKSGFMQGIALYTSLREKMFTVEIGVIKKGFFWSAPFEIADWREYGMRTRLWKLMHLDAKNTLDRDFFRYDDQESLESAVKRALEAALVYGPSEWDRIGRRLVGEV